MFPFFYAFFSHLFGSFRPPPPPVPQSSISNPNNTTATAPHVRPDHLISPTQSDRPILSLNSFDLETGNQTPPPILAGNHNWRRISKVVQTVGLGGFGASVTLLVNAPGSATTHPALYTAYLTVVCLGIITSISLSAFSVIMDGSLVVGWVQENLIYFTLFFVTSACFLRLYLTLRLADIGFGMVPLLIGLAFIVLYLQFGIRRRHQTQETGGES